MRLAILALTMLGLMSVGTRRATADEPPATPTPAPYATTAIDQTVVTPVRWDHYRPAPRWHGYHRYPTYYHGPRYHAYPGYSYYYSAPYTTYYSPYGYGPGVYYYGPRMSFRFGF